MHDYYNEILTKSWFYIPLIALCLAFISMGSSPNTLVIKIFYLQVTLSLSTVPAYNCEHLFQVSVISSRWVFTLLDTNSMHSNMLLRSTYMVQQYNIVIHELEKLVNTKHILPNYHALTADRPVCCCAVTFEISSSEP